MNNPRLKGVVNLFGEKYQLADNLPNRFQVFANYLLLKKIYFEINEEYPYESLLDIDLLNSIDFDIVTEDHKENSMAVDGCFIIHEKSIIHLGMDEDEIQQNLSSVKSGILHVILIQSKSGKIDTNDLSTLSDCLNTNFSEQKNWAKFSTLRIQCESLLQSAPKVKIIFRTIYVTGNENDKNLFLNSTFIVREDALKLAMKKYFWIKEDLNCKVDYFDEIDLYEEYEKQTDNAKVINETLLFEVITDEIISPGYGKIRFGAISLGEMMKILLNPDTSKPNELYGYNVRDVIKGSSINPKIESSIKTNKDMFLLLNNGITIVVDKQERRTDKGIYLENIRIVNGCQTSHAILYVCTTSPEYNDAKVSIKIIETDKDDILGKITYSSNNQNTVSKANLFAIEPSIFELEKSYKDFFLGYSGQSLKHLNLERRQGQYNNSDAPFIDMLAQAKSFIALWNKTPHFAVMYAEQNLDQYKTQLEEKNFIEKSLFSGILWYNVIKRVPNVYNNARFHIFSCIGIILLERILSIDNILELDTNDINVLIDCINMQEVLIKLDINISLEVDKVCKTIDLLEENFPKLSSRKIHYRKFYPQDTLKIIYLKHKETYGTN